MNTKLIRALLAHDEFDAISDEVLDVIDNRQWKYVDKSGIYIGQIAWIEHQLHMFSKLPADWYTVIADLLIESVEATDIEFGNENWSIKNKN